MQILIVEDDKLAALVLLKHLKESDTNAQTTIAGSIKEARNLINEQQYDLIFLDIHLKDGKGPEIINELPANQKLIFVTSDPQYAIEAFDHNALDYLLKPVSNERFQKTLERLKAKDEKEGNIVVRADFNFHKLKTSDILYIKSNGDYISLTTDNDTYTFHGRLKNFILKLPAENFKKCHRSYIVNIDRVDRMDKSHLIIEDVSIPISRTFKKEMSSIFKK